jgi:hypothetical protein
MSKKTTWSNSLIEAGTRKGYAVTAISGESGDPPANACAPDKKRAAREEKRKRTIKAADDNTVSPE